VCDGNQTGIKVRSICIGTGYQLRPLSWYRCYTDAASMAIATQRAYKEVGQSCSRRCCLGEAGDAI